MVHSWYMLRVHQWAYVRMCAVVLFLNANCLTFPEILLILTRFCCTMLGAREFARKRPSRGASFKEMWWFSGDLWSWSLLITDYNPLRESCLGAECLISQIRGFSWCHVFESPIRWLEALKLKQTHFISKTSCHLALASNKQQDNSIQSKKNMNNIMIIVRLWIFWWWTWLYVGVADRLVSSQIWHFLVWHRFCAQALAEALKVNTTVTNINLGGNDIGKEGAKAWCLARGSVAPGLETVK